MPNEMTAADCAERLENAAFATTMGSLAITPMITALNLAASTMRKVAAGELVEVVHARWIEEFDDVGLSWGSYYCSHCHKSPANDYNEKPYLSDFCPSCGAKMDEKGDKSAEVH